MTCVTHSYSTVAPITQHTVQTQASLCPQLHTEIQSVDHFEWHTNILPLHVSFRHDVSFETSNVNSNLAQLLIKWSGLWPVVLLMHLPVRFRCWQRCPSAMTHRLNSQLSRKVFGLVVRSRYEGEKMIISSNQSSQPCKEKVTTLEWRQGFVPPFFPLLHHTPNILPV